MTAKQINIIKFTVPRKMEGMDEELYPEMLSTESSISCEDWISGKNNDPSRCKVKEGG